MSKSILKKNFSGSIFMGWLLGLIFLISGISTITSSLTGGLFFIIAGTIVLPPTKKFFASKLNKGLSNGVAFTLSILLGFIALAIISPSPETTNTATTTQDKNQEEKVKQQNNTVQEEKPMTVNTTEFIAEFDKNQLAAEKKYEGRLIEFTAKVENISEDIIGDPYLILNPLNAGQYYYGTGIQCTFEDEAPLLSLENGQTVTLQGEFSSQTFGTILVTDCVVAG